VHGLVTISELFASSNLINTGVVNCLVVLECTQNAPFRGKKVQKLQPPPHWGGVHPLPKPYPPRRLRRLDLDLTPQTKILDSLVINTLELFNFTYALG